jgi:putative mRNA 3-end processing factor
MVAKKGNETMLFDYGFLPVSPPEFPMKAPRVKDVFLSHCHIDHSGLIPWLARRFDSAIYAAPPTIDICKILLDDSVKISEYEATPLPYNKKDVRKTMRNFRPLEFGEKTESAGYEIRSHSAGHVPGAAMYEIVGRKNTLFTGDMNTLSTHLVHGANPVKCDNLIIEATYAGRNHPDRLKAEFEFVQKIKQVVGMGGKVIIPSFAVGRTQEVLLILRGQKFDTILDGMGAAVNGVYLNWPKYLRSRKKLRSAINNVHVVRNARDRNRVDPEVIVTTSGMLDGGPVIEYLKRYKNDSRNAILLTGYQVEGTNGRKLMDEGSVNLYGSDEKVNTKLEFFDFSAHAGHDELVRFVEACDPEKVILMHGDNRQVLAKDLVGREVHLPKEGEWLEI